jgi:NifU-like domain
MLEEKELQRRMRQIEDLVHKLDASSDPEVRSQTKALVQAIMDLHGTAIERMMECISAPEAPSGSTLIDSIAEDPVAGGILVLYGLHPWDLESRVGRAIEKARSILRQYGSQVELTGVAGGEVRVRVRGIDGAFTARSVKSAIEDEIYAAAPDATSVVIQGLESFSSADFIPLDKVGAAPAMKGAV